MKNRIAVFANGYNRYATLKALDGMRTVASEKDFDIDAFVGYAAYNESPELNAGRAGIYWLPKLENYDGVIVFSGLINDFDTAKQICLNAREKNVPVVSIGAYVDGIPFVGSNNETGMRELVEHLVKEHGIKRAVYIGGSREHIDTSIRQSVIEDVFKENGLELKKEDIYYADWINEHAAEIASKIAKSETGLPDAMICANDVMALAVSGRLIQMGYKLPEDIIITGFDHIEESEITYPALTTVEQDYFTIGSNAATLLCDIIEGSASTVKEVISSHAVIAESCGCRNNREYDEARRVYCRSVHTIKRDLEFFERLCRMERNEILKSSGYEDMKEHLRNFYKDNNYAVGNDFYMVLNSEYFNDPDPDDSLILKAGYDAKLDVTVALRNGKIASGKLRPGEIIPGYKKKPGKQSLFFFFPFSSGRFNYGYFAFKEAPVMISENLGVYDYMEKLEQTFMEYRLKMRLDEANRELTDLYNKDPLTGLYNRFCFDSIAELLYEESVGQDRPLSIMFTDINYMKNINDEHGHITGDQSIVAVADAIVNSIGPDALAVRYGGDEFIILSPDTDDAGSKAIRSQIDKNLKSLCRARKIPGKVSVSCGYVITDPKSGKTLDEYINEADKVMYAIKKEIHKED